MKVVGARLKAPLLLLGIQGGAVASAAFHPLMPLMIAGGGLLTVLLVHYGQVSLVLLADVGLVKGFLLYQFPFFEVFDLTVILSLIIFIALVLRTPDPAVRRNLRAFQFIIVAFAVWVLWMIVSSGHSPRLDLAMEKSLRFALFATPLFLGPLVFIRTRADSRNMLKIFLAVGMLGVIVLASRFLTLSTPSSIIPGPARLSILAANPIAAGRVLAICAAMCAAVILSGYGKLAVWGLPLVLFFLAALFTGSRGPMLSFMGATFLIGMLLSRRARRRTVYGSLLLVVVVILVFVFSPEGLTSRYRLFLEGGELAETRQGLIVLNTFFHRIFLWEKALTLWTTDLWHLFIGVGTAGYIGAFTWRDVEYPHNLVLELLTEYGLIGLTVFSVHVLLIARHVFQRAGRWLQPEVLMWLAGSLTIFLATFVSGDLNDNRLLWFFLAGLLATANLKDRESAPLGLP